MLSLQSVGKTSSNIFKENVCTHVLILFYNNQLTVNIIKLTKLLSQFTIAILILPSTI